MKAKNIALILAGVLLIAVTPFGSLSTVAKDVLAEAMASLPSSSQAGPVAAPAGTAFTYQGQLTRAGTPVSDACSMQFSLWDSDVGGSQIGGTLLRSTVQVEEGLFTIDDLDFGAGAFPGQARWLEIAVQCPGDADYTTLDARQAITLTPYALYSFDSDALDGLHAGDFSLAGHKHDHAALTGLSNDDHPQYFNLSQDETVTGIPAFNGGTSGVSAPFSVDSTYGVPNLNADLLDGQHGSAYALTGHTHNAADITAGTLASSRLSGSYTGIAAVGTLASLSVTGDLTTGGRYTYSSPVTRFYSVGASEFVPGNGTVTSSGIDAGGVDRYIATCGAASCSLVAPIHVPRGGLMSAFQCRVIDNDAARQVKVTLGANAGNGVFGTLVGCDATTGGDSPNVQVITNTTCTFTYDNLVAAYLLRFTTASGAICSPASACRVNECWISYTELSVP